MPARRILSRFLIVLLLGATPGRAHQDEPCTAFRDGRVDPGLVAIMLTAAEQGKLYRVDRKQSRIGFCVDSHFMRIEGYFEDFQGGMAFDPHQLDADQILVLVQTDSLATSWTFIENMLKGESFFDTERHPDILFVSTHFHWHTTTTATVTGQLTLHGITRPVDFDLELTDTQGKPAHGTDRIHVTATTTIRRSDFGMSVLQAVVDDEVQLCLDIEAAQHRHEQPATMSRPDSDTASGFNE